MTALDPKRDRHSAANDVNPFFDTVLAITDASAIADPIDKVCAEIDTLVKT